MRNVKFAGWLVARYDDYSARYVEACQNNSPQWMRDHYSSKLNRLRNVLEYRYTTIV